MRASSLFVVLSFAFTGLSPSAWAETSKRSRANPRPAAAAKRRPTPAAPRVIVEDAPVPAAPKVSAVSPERTGTQDTTIPDGRFYSYKLNTFFGMSVVRRLGFGVGAQLGYAPTRGTPFYLGPEVSFALYSPGTLLQTLGTLWYEVGISGAPRLGLVVGAGAGAGFSSQLTGVSTTSAVVFADLGITQTVDDLASIWARFRPGMAGGGFAFQLILSASFRFL